MPFDQLRDAPNHARWQQIIVGALWLCLYLRDASPCRTVSFPPYRSRNRLSLLLLFCSKMHCSLISVFTVFATIQVSLGAPAPVPAPQSVSKTARCGPSFGLTCLGSSWGNCCSQHGYCGSTAAYCGTGCQTGFGSCNSLPGPIVSASVSKNGKCGGSSGSTCLGSTYGNCCR
jgi:hypothetical protein